MQWVVPLLLAQSLGPSFFLDDATLGPSGGSQSTPAIAWVNGRFFTVFSDTRDGRRADLWYRHLDAQGAPLGAVARPLIRTAGAQTQPAAEAGPTQVLVAWLDDTVCASEVKAQHFSYDGLPLGPVIDLTIGGCTTERPSIAYDPSSALWLVAWGGHGAGREVHGSLLDTGGTRVSAFVIGSGPNEARAVSVTPSPSGGFLVAWSDDRQVAGTSNIYVSAVSTTGAVTAAVQTAPSGVDQLQPCLAGWRGGVAMVAWVEGAAVRAQPVSALGTPVGPPLDVATGPVSDVSCARGPSGEVVLALTDGRGTSRGVYLRTVATDAGISAEFAAAPGNGYHERVQPRLAVGVTEAVLVVGGQWDFVTDNEVMARGLELQADRVADAGPFTFVSTGTVRHRRAMAAFDGARYLAAWREDGRNTAGSDSFGVFVEPGPSQVQPDAGLRFSNGSANLNSYPTIAAAPDGGFFVTWGDDGSSGLLRGRTVSTAGALGSVLTLSDASNFVEIHATGWFDETWATASSRSDLVRLRRTTRAGAAALTETTLQGTAGAPPAVEVATLGRTLLVVYPVRDAGLDVRGFRYDADAGLLDPSGFLLAGGAGDQTSPAIAAGASLFLSAWSADGGVFASRVTEQGAVLDVLSLGSNSGAATPAVGWTGRSFLVAWAQGEDVWATRVAEDGQVLDVPPLVIASGDEIERLPRVVGGPPSEALITWEVFHEPLGGFRIAGRSFTDPGIDAGTPDAGSIDAGAVDAGAADGGAADAGAADGGAVDDAGVSDAGPTLEADAGSSQRTPTHYLVGCSHSPGALLLALSLLLFRRTRGIETRPD